MLISRSMELTNPTLLLCNVTCQSGYIVSFRLSRFVSREHGLQVVCAAQNHAFGCSRRNSRFRRYPQTQRDRRKQVCHYRSRTQVHFSLDPEVVGESVSAVPRVEGNLCNGVHFLESRTRPYEDIVERLTCS